MLATEALAQCNPFRQNLLVFEIDSAPDDGSSPVGVPDLELSPPSPLPIDDATPKRDHFLSEEEREKLKRNRFRSALVAI